MAVVVPFQGVRYNPEKIEKLENVITPPYDVISAEAGAELLKKNPYSMIRLDLRNTSQDSTEDNGRYEEARDLFQDWQKEGVLIHDQQPSIYLYFIDYTHPGGSRLTRKGLVALVGLSEFSEQVVKPHEKTFSGVIADRVKLMETCQAQFSQIFSLYSDPEQRVIAELEKKRHPEPICQINDHDNNTHTLWQVTDPDALELVQQFFADKPVYIADGHHRYTTSLECRKQALARNPNLPANHPANTIMMYLCGYEDKGLSVLPTHRLVKWPGKMGADQMSEKMAADLQVTEIKTGARETLVAELLNRIDEAAMDTGLPAFGAYHAGEDRAFLLSMKNEHLTAALADKPDELRKLDVVVLSELLINKSLGLSHEQCVKGSLISYISDPDTALDAAVKESVLQDAHTPILFFLNPTRVEQVINVADNGLIMPHKSTYFYPKIMTGLVIRSQVSEAK